MSRQQEQKQINMALAYDFYAANPGGSIYDLAGAQDMELETARRWTKALLFAEALTQIKGRSNLHERDKYFVVEGRRPKGVPENAVSIRTERADKGCTQLMTKAKQCGMKRDSLVAAFFGPAGQVSA